MYSYSAEGNIKQAPKFLHLFILYICFILFGVAATESAIRLSVFEVWEGARVYFEQIRTQYYYTNVTLRWWFLFSEVTVFTTIHPWTVVMSCNYCSLPGHSPSGEYIMKRWQRWTSFCWAWFSQIIRPVYFLKRDCRSAFSTRQRANCQQSCRQVKLISSCCHFQSLQIKPFSQQTWVSTKEKKVAMSTLTHQLGKNDNLTPDYNMFCSWSW